jgi:PAS domain S-box-containing protein
MFSSYFIISGTDTALHIILPDGRVFLRMHDKERYGDLVKRNSLSKARTTKNPAWEIELGKTAFALRTVMPYYKDGKLIGYVELAEDIDHFLKILKGNTDDEFGIIADKKYLDRDDWKSIRRASGLKDNWNELEKHLIISSTSKGEIAAKCFVEDNLERVENGENIFQKIKDKDSTYRCGGFSMEDALGRHIGAVLTAVDITDHIAFSKKADYAGMFSAIILFFLTSSAAVIIARSISRPILKLSDLAEKVGKGDLQQRAAVTSDDEIGQLGRTFNSMIEKRKQIEDELRESRERFRSVSQSANDAIIVSDHQGTIILWNRGAQEIFGYTEDEAIGKPLIILLPGRYKQAHEEGIARYIVSGEPHIIGKTVELHGIKKNGCEFPIELSLGIWRTGKDTYCSAIIRDITERMKLEEQLRHAQKMEAIGTLVGGIAHDFNNILNVIIGYGGLIELRMKKDDPFIHHLKEMLAGGRKAVQLTKGLIAFSRKQVMEMRPVNINDIIIGFKKMTERIIGEDIELRIITSEEDLIIKADTGQIEQVLMNLSVNARDAMPNGGVLTLEAEIVRMDDEFIDKHGFGEPGEYAFISVTDTGKGIEENIMGRIFEPYFTTKGIAEGTGLGLSIVYGIIKQHNGFIDCISEPGKGTAFNIYLPVIPDSVLQKEYLSDQESEIQNLRSKKGETILLAEDDSAVRGLIKQVLENFGYKIIEAVGGEDAVNKFNENKDSVQLILFDLIMPGKNGKEAYEEIKGMKHDIKAVFISGYTPELIRSKGLSENGLEFIPKPFTTNALLIKVREILDK